MRRDRRQRADSAMKKTLLASQSLDDTLLQEAAAKTFLGSPVPATGANAVPVTPVTSTPIRGSRGPVQEEDEEMQEGVPAGAVF